MKDKAEGNIESIKWWPRLDVNIHFASVIPVMDNIIPLDTTPEMGSDFEQVQG